MRKVLEQLSLDDDGESDAEMADGDIPLPLIEATPSKKKKEKKDNPKVKFGMRPGKWQSNQDPERVPQHNSG